MDLLVTTEWLADHLGDDNLCILDASYFLKQHERDASAEYAAAHIPSAVFLDLEHFADPESALPSMVPPVALAEQKLGALGITRDTDVVVYDASPLHSAARGWWLLRLFGVKSVAILDGGLAKWRAEQREIALGIDNPEPGNFVAVTDLSSVRNLEQMMANLDTKAEQVVDARGPARFAGSEPEQRPGCEAGHIPGARNVHFASLFNADGTWKRGAALAAAFTAQGIDLEQPVVTTCGSGITAAVLVFGTQLLGHQAALYDGSWAQWGTTASAPKATGAA